MNAQLRKVLQSAYSAALVSFLVGTAGAGRPDAGHAHRAAGARHAGGGAAVGLVRRLFGAFYVAISTIVAAELGATSLLVLALAGQLAMALVVDHFGWLGLPENPITWVRLLGVALLGVGVWLITR